ncbi:hypothetical protein D3C87_1690500 [compost metagenome]
MPSTTRRIMSMGPSIIASNDAIQSSRVQSRKSPGSGPSALLIRMSGCGHAAMAASRPCSWVRSADTQPTPMPASLEISAAVCASVSGLRAAMVTATPSRANCSAQARPMPRLPPNTKAVLPLIPRSMPNSPLTCCKPRGDAAPKRISIGPAAGALDQKKEAPKGLLC